jgi:hypothetical protein
MEKFQELREQAKKSISTAEHMLTQTYPSLQDPRLLLVVMEHTLTATISAIGSILNYERTFKKIPIYSDNFDSMLNMFQMKVMPMHKIDGKYASMARDIKETLERHKKSPVEFSKKDSLVIYDKEYDMKSVSALKLRECIYLAKELILISEKITSKNEEIFNNGEQK